MGDRNYLGFSVGIGIDLVFVHGVEIDSILCAGRKLLEVSVWIEIDLLLVWGSKLNCFLCAGRRRLVFYLGID